MSLPTFPITHTPLLCPHEWEEIPRNRLLIPVRCALHEGHEADGLPCGHVLPWGGWRWWSCPGCGVDFPMDESAVHVPGCPLPSLRVILLLPAPAPGPARPAP